MKKVCMVLLVVALLIGVLFIPIPQSLRDGGTKVYSAILYKKVEWNRRIEEERYRAERWYWFPDNLKSLDALWEPEEDNVLHRFVAEVKIVGQDTVIVEPVEGEDEREISRSIQFNTTELEDIGIKGGSSVEVCYRGKVMPTCVLGLAYTAQIRATQWSISDDLRFKNYSDHWLERDMQHFYDLPYECDIVVTKIYKNCFFAKTVDTTAYEIKVNTDLPDDTCLGDRLRCTFQNIWYDPDSQRVEVDLFSDISNDRYIPYKPVIYLYPEEEQEVSVKLDLDGKLTCTYPAYQNGWKVLAAPDGTLTDDKGQIYNYLYWEGQTDGTLDWSEGFCIKGEDTAAFMEVALEKLGLNRREANEFIVYWLPLMEQNPYNVITFQTSAYTDANRLYIDPAPDTLIRVFMAWKMSDCFVDLPPQSLTAPDRTGFTAVEWGGTEVK